MAPAESMADPFYVSHNYATREFGLDEGELSNVQQYFYRPEGGSDDDVVWMYSRAELEAMSAKKKAQIAVIRSREQLDKALQEMTTLRMSIVEPGVDQVRIPTDMSRVTFTKKDCKTFFGLADTNLKNLEYVRARGAHHYNAEDIFDACKTKLGDDELERRKESFWAPLEEGYRERLKFLDDNYPDLIQQSVDRALRGLEVHLEECQWALHKANATCQTAKDSLARGRWLYLDGNDRATKRLKQQPQD